MRNTMTQIFDGASYTITHFNGDILSISVDGTRAQFKYIGYDDVCDEYHYTIIKPNGELEGLIVDLNDEGEVEYFYPIQVTQ